MFHRTQVSIFNLAWPGNQARNFIDGPGQAKISKFCLTWQPGLVTCQVPARYQVRLVALVCIDIYIAVEMPLLSHRASSK